MPRLANSTTPARVRNALRTLRLRRTARARTAPALPVVVHLVADDEVDQAAIAASSLAWRRRFRLGDA